jgi:hypothetical protein
MVNAINDKKLFNSMEIDRKMKYQSLGIQNLRAKGEQFQVDSKQAIILLCGRQIFLTGLRNDFTARNKYSSANRSHAITVRLADFFKVTGINLLAVMTIFKVLLLSQTVLDQVESVMAIDLIWI